MILIIITLVANGVHAMSPEQKVNRLQAFCAKRLLLPERTFWGDPFVCLSVLRFRDFTEGDMGFGKGLI